MENHNFDKTINDLLCRSQELEEDPFAQIIIFTSAPSVTTEPTHFSMIARDSTLIPGFEYLEGLTTLIDDSSNQVKERQRWNSKL